jgi:MoaA/NifB/PqqE/SkfB family radical SAM enzyme
VTLNKQYSSFSQTKGLLWREWFDGILGGKLLPPVGCVVDLTNACNLGCGWCNARHFRSKETLNTEDVKALVDRIADWGCGSVCYAGGGEPTLHPDFAEIVKYSAEQGLEVGISTNGTLLSPEIIDSVVGNARFCGVSVDAGYGSTWCKIKHVARSELWNDLFRNMTNFAQAARGTGIDSTYKFMVVPENQDEIAVACRNAKFMGFKSFFVRPAAFEGVPSLSDRTEEFDVALIGSQVAACETIEDAGFRVYSSFGRVGKQMQKEQSFDRCRASPLIGVFCADGFAYLCIDSRGRPERRLCRNEELFKYWGSEAHLKRIAEVDLSECPRCAFGHYQEQLQAYAADYMYRWFP